MSTILLFLVSGVVSQSVLRTQFSANARLPEAMKHGKMPNIKAFSGRLSGGSGESMLPQVNGEAQANIEAMPGPTSGYGPDTFSRRTLAGILATGALVAPSVDPKRSWAAGSDIGLCTFGKEAEQTKTKHIWTYLKGATGDPIKDGNLLFKGGLFQGANVKGPPPGIKEKFLLGNIDGLGFPDVTSCEGIAITANNINLIPVPQVDGFTGVSKGFIDTEIPEYKGYSLIIGKGKKGSFYKAPFTPSLNKFSTVKIPFKEFTNSFDSETGNAIDTCKANPENCPGPKTLENMKQMIFVAQELNTAFKLEVKDVSAYGCTAVAQLAAFDEGSGISSLWLLTAVSLGLLVFFILQIRTRPALRTPPLLG